MTDHNLNIAKPRIQADPPHQANTAVSIIVITLNEARRITTILDDLARQTYRNFEVIIVDSNSDDNTCELADRFRSLLPELTIHIMQARGVCLGRNTGAKLAKYDRLLFLDADVRLEANFLAQAVSQLERRQLKVAGIYMNAKRLPKHFKVGYHLFNAGIFVTQFVFPTAVGACLFSDKTIHERMGGFDASVTLCEDCDYVNRAAKLTTFRMLTLTFGFDPRRLRQDGYLNTGRKYLYANLHRLLIGEIRAQKITYPFGHYKSDS